MESKEWNPGLIGQIEGDRAELVSCVGTEGCCLGN